MSHDHGMMGKEQKDGTVRREDNSPVCGNGNCSDLNQKICIYLIVLFIQLIVCVV